VFANVQAITEAELAAEGICPVSVVHGDAETAEDAEVIYETLPRLARECGELTGWRGGNQRRLLAMVRQPLEAVANRAAGGPRRAARQQHQPGHPSGASGSR